MRRIALIALAAAFWLPAADTDPVAPDEIIAKFAAKEAEFAKARENYTYRQTFRVLELTESGSVQGKLEMTTDIIFSPDGKRSEKVVWAPTSTLKVLLLEPDDMADLRGVQPFVLTINELPKYHVRYLGRQEAVVGTKNSRPVPSYVFAVKPKKMESGERYFEGQIWVDDKDYQIVKTYGRGVGLKKKGDRSQFPRFETFRERIDGKYWFPEYTYADDTLVFPDMAQRIRMIVKYEDYKQFKAEATIKYGEVVEEKKPETKK